MLMLSVCCDCWLVLVLLLVVLGLVYLLLVYFWFI